MDDTVRRKKMQDGLVKLGLLPSEARKLCFAKVNQYDTSLQSIDHMIPLIRKVARSRVRVINNLKHMGWTRDEILQSIKILVKNQEGNGGVFAFIRSEYSIPDKDKPDYKLAVRARAAQANRSISRMFKKITGISYKSHLPVERLRGIPVKNLVNQENMLF
jgi:hypothetical protein